MTLGQKEKKSCESGSFFFLLHDDIYPVYHHKDNQLGKNLHTPQWGQFFLKSKLHLHNLNLLQKPQNICGI